MRTIDIEIAVMQFIGIRRNIIVPNVSWGMNIGLHECDLLCLSASNYATEVEIKVSKSDLKKDNDKGHGHFHNHIKYLYFAVPEKLVEFALQHIPERAGLLSVKKHAWGTGHEFKVEKVRKARQNPNAVQWTLKQRCNLGRLGTMRICGLLQTISNR